MIFFRPLLSILAAFILFVGIDAHAVDPSLDMSLYPNIEAIKQHDKTDLIEVTLRNGMTIFLKATAFDEDDIQIQFLALGGYHSLNKELRGTGRLAAPMVWRSGVGEYLGDKLTCLMYDASIEMTPSIEAFSRQIEVAVPSESIEKALQLIQLIFTEPQYSEKEAAAVIAAQEEVIRGSYFDYDHIFKDMSSTLNSGGSIYLKPLTIRGIKKVESDQALSIFKQAFSNPAEFKAVIIGDMDVKKVLAIVDKHLGSITRKKEGTWPAIRPVIAFPEGVHEEVVPGKIRPEMKTRLTFPVKEAIKEDNFARLQLLSEVVEYRLREAIRSELGHTYSIDTALELPLYPYHADVWFTIQYTASKEVAPQIQKVVFAELQRLQKEGIAPDQLIHVKDTQKKTDQFWLQDNHYWLSMLLNYSVWGWDPDAVIYDYDKGVNLDDVSIQKALKSFISLDNYTGITSVN